MPKEILTDEKGLNSSQKEAAFKKAKQIGTKHLEKLLKRAERRAKESHEAWQQCCQWQKIHHEGLLIQANLFRILPGMREIMVEDWGLEGRQRSIELDTALDPHKQAAKRFLRSKKLRLGVPHKLRQCQLAEAEVALYKQQLAAISDITLQESLESYCLSHHIPLEKKKKTEIQKEKELPKPYHIYVSETGSQIWVGKNAKANDLLTFHHAKGSDWWLHTKDYPGSHVILRGFRGEQPDEASLKDAGELALRYSQAKKLKESEVCLSQVKWLKRVKGAPGRVTLSKHTVLYVKLDEVRYQRLKQGKNQKAENKQDKQDIKD